MQPAWADLLTRSAELNAFMHPGLAIAAADSYPEQPVQVVTAWQERNGVPTLVGLWSLGQGQVSPMPISVLKAPCFPHGFLATPVVDLMCIHEALHAMLDAIEKKSYLPNIVVLQPFSADGPVMAALERVLAERGTLPCVMRTARRPILDAGLEAPNYFERAISAASRKKLRQHRRRLAEQDGLATSVVTGGAELEDALETFLALERSGWKGRRNTALTCDPRDAAFFRLAIGSAAGAISVHSLRLDGRPISMQIVLRAGQAAFTWKTTYDESFEDRSPGMLLFQDCTEEFIRDRSIAFVDSCSYDDSGYMAAWSERRAVSDVWIDVRRNGSMAFPVLSGLQKLYLEIRQVVKRQIASRLHRSRSK